MRAKRIREALFARFVEKNSAGFIIHDRDLRRWALSINSSMEHSLAGFTASASWVRLFKRRYNIVSRKITKFISQKTIADKEKIKAAGDEFVANFRETMQNFLPTQIVNFDQSSFSLEIHTGKSQKLVIHIRKKGWTKFKNWCDVVWGFGAGYVRFSHFSKYI